MQDQAALPLTDAPTEQDFDFLASTSFRDALSAAEEGKVRRISGVGYSGGVIDRHPFWDRVMFDLASAELASPSLPILAEHEGGKRIGHAEVTVSDQVAFSGRMLSNEIARSVAADADEGFPFQMSVRISPRRIDFLREGEFEVVNGRQVEGPLHVFRDSLIREISVTPTGADHKTSLQVFNAQHRHEDSPMSGKTEADFVRLENDMKQATKDRDTFEDRAKTAETENERLKTELAKVTDESEKNREALNKFHVARRTEQVKSLFKALGREFSDEAAKPYLDMPEESFAVLLKDVGTKADAPDGDTLFKRTEFKADGGPEGQGGGDAGATARAKTLSQKAQEYQAEQEKAGVPCTFTDAVKHVRKQASQ